MYFVRQRCNEPRLVSRWRRGQGDGLRNRGSGLSWFPILLLPARIKLRDMVLELT